mmetsp:Transcript_40273/g.115129  ORF Transcript_40273/g.115129 Transcript_40273/m.115129 type:complete len:219 (+) Transcript_40273:366-1022(+)
MLLLYTPMAPPNCFRRPSVGRWSPGCAVPCAAPSPKPVSKATEETAVPSSPVSLLTPDRLPRNRSRLGSRRRRWPPSRSSFRTRSSWLMMFASTSGPSECLEAGGEGGALGVEFSTCRGLAWRSGASLRLPAAPAISLNLGWLLGPLKGAFRSGLATKTDRGPISAGWAAPVPLDHGAQRSDSRRRMSNALARRPSPATPRPSRATSRERLRGVAESC